MMKTPLYPAWKFLYCSVVLIIVGTGCHTMFPSEVAVQSKIGRLKGAARCQRENDKTWRTAKAGGVFNPGSLIQTGDKSYMVILLGESSWPLWFNEDTKQINILQLYSNCRLRIDKVAIKNNSRQQVETQLYLATGQMGGWVKNLPSGSNYEVGFPGGVARMRSAFYTLTDTGELTVRGGAVTVTLESKGLTREVAAGQKFDPTTGQVSQAKFMNYPDSSIPFFRCDPLGWPLPPKRKF